MKRAPLPSLRRRPPSTADGLVRVATSRALYKGISRLALMVAALVTARELGPSGRGVLVLLLTSATLAVMVCSFGVNTSGRVCLVSAVDHVEASAYFGLSGVLTLFQAAVCFLLSVTLLPFLGVLLTPSDQLLFSFLGASFIVRYLLNDALNAYGFTTLSAGIDTGANIAQMVFVLALAATGSDSVNLFVTAIAAANVLQIGFALAALCRRGVPIRPRYRPGEWVLLLRKGIPGIPMALGEVLTFRLDQYLVAAFLTPADVGIYSVAATAAQLLHLPPTALGPPIFHRLASGTSRLSDLQRVQALCLAATVALAGGTFIAAPVVVRSLLGASYEEAIDPLRILLLAEIGITIFYLNSSALGGMNRLRDAAVASVAGLVVVALADAILIPAFELSGAAWASVVAYWAMGLTALAFLRRHAKRASSNGGGCPVSRGS